MASSYDVKNALNGHPRYTRERDLGSGTFGSVQLCRDARNKDAMVAVKLIPRGERTITEYVESEVKNFRTLLHPHIVQLQEVFVTEHFLGIAMEYANGGDTFDYVVKCRGIKEAEARWLFQQLIIALDYCHRRGIVNRDLKLENTLLHWHPGRTWPTIKLCDFGYSKNENTQAPEVVSNRPRDGQTYDGRQADVWSCGVILYIMLCARFPFERPEDSSLPYADKLKKVLQRIVKVEYTFPSSIHLSAECKDLLEHILVADPAKRFTIHDIVKHPWFAHDLPDGALAMNERFIQQQPIGPGFQSLESISAILEEARRDPSEVLNGLLQHGVAGPR